MMRLPRDYRFEALADAALRRAAFSFRLRFSLGFSKCWCLRTSARIPAFSHFFLNRRSALSKDSPSFTRIPGKLATPPHRGKNMGKQRLEGRPLDPLPVGQPSRGEARMSTAVDDSAVEFDPSPERSCRTHLVVDRPGGTLVSYSHRINSQRFRTGGTAWRSTAASISMTWTGS
jgi:hypothetical protein